MERLATFQQLFARRGPRVTSRRLGIYRYLETDTHPTAGKIYRALKPCFPDGVSNRADVQVMRGPHEFYGLCEGCREPVPR